MKSDKNELTQIMESINKSARALTLVLGRASFYLEPNDSNGNDDALKASPSSTENAIDHGRSNKQEAPSAAVHYDLIRAKADAFDEYIATADYAINKGGYDSLSWIAPSMTLKAILAVKTLKLATHNKGE